MSGPTDVEVDRALNALHATLNDQRVQDPDAARLQEIADGTSGGERVLSVRPLSPSAWALDDAASGAFLARVEHEGGGAWSVRREAMP